MRMSRKLFLMVVLVAVNLFLAAGSVRADNHNKRCTYEEGSQGVCQEFCWTTCYECHCGGDCEDNCGPE